MLNALPPRSARLARIRIGMVGHWPEAVSLAAIIALGAFVRFHYLALGPGWDSDQGTEMLAMWNAIHSGAVPLLGPVASTGTLHHGALYYYLMLPAVWLGGGDPRWVTAEISLAALTVVPAVWWVARSIAGPAAGIAAAAIASTAGGLVLFSQFIWNPTLVEPGAALALLGAWGAWSSRRPAWLLIAAAGTAIAMQAEVVAGVIVLPMGIVLLALLWRGPRGRRRNIAAWGAAAVALIVATYVPFMLYELGHNFSQSRAILDFLTGPGQSPSHGPTYRVAFSGLRIMAWPTIGWPIWVDKTKVAQAAIVAGILSAGLVWRLVVTTLPYVRRRRDLADRQPDASIDASGARTQQRDGTWLVAVCLGLIILGLGLGMRDVAEIGPDLTEQYHIVADPFVIVAAGIVVGSFWRLTRRDRLVKLAGRAAFVVILGLIVNSNSGQWAGAPTSFTWPAAQAAANRIESVTAGQPIALGGLPNDRSTDAYAYPLVRDGVVPVAPAQGSFLVVLCDASRSSSCGGPAEDALVAGEPASAGYSLVDRFSATPVSILSIYLRR